MPPTLLLLLVLASPAVAQDNLRVLPAEPKPDKMLHDFLLKEAQKHFDARRQAIAKLTTPEQIQERHQDLRAKFLHALGGFPEKTPLNAKTAGTLKGDGFIVERVIFESRPNHHVTANLYLPEKFDGKIPGVLVPCGHSTNGKAAEAYQRGCIAMAQHGMAVLCYDPIGQGERLQLLDKSGKAGIPGSTSEHTMVGVGALLVGQSTATYRIWDGIRALDYLAGRPEVDPAKLGCTGNSGGGTLTAYLMVLDERIQCAAPSCYITSLEKLFATIGPQDAEQNITGQVAFGMEHADYLTMRAPKPTLMAVATRDFFDIAGARATFQEAGAVYKKLGQPERLGFFEYDDKHGWSQPRREACLQWMRRWLQGIDDKAAEKKVATFKDEDLQCTRSGQVLEDFKGTSAFHLNMQRAKALAGERAKFADRTRRQQRDVIGGLLHLQPRAAEPLAAGEPIRREGYTIHRWAYETEPGIQVPALLFVPGKSKETGQLPLTIYLDDRGMAAEAAPGGWLEQYAQAGKLALALDVRGLGETSPGTLKGKSYFGADFKHAFLGLHLNRPLLGQRVDDVLSVVRYVAGSHQGPIHIKARGQVGLAALHAAALTTRIEAVEIHDGLISWHDVVHTPVSYQQLAWVVPGVLKHYDLPELASMIAPRPLTLRQTHNAQGTPVAASDVEAAYATTRRAYENLNAGKTIDHPINRLRA